MTENQTLQSTEARRRYPGPRPFTYDDRHVFKGRQREVTELVENIRQYMHLLLYARSGIGKSSLIEAGLLPELERLGGYVPFKIVFGAYNKKAPIPPLEAAILHLQKDNAHLNYLDKLIFKENSLWYQLKSLQCSYYSLQNEKEKQSLPGKQILLIFDQFEELFTYPQEDILTFKQALAEALFTQIPDIFRTALIEKGESGGLKKSEVEMLHTPLNIKVLFSIRSDRIALLNFLTDYLPEILKNFYEIKPLTREQSTQAIIDPAQMESSFDSPPFTYDPALLSEILDFLSKDQEQYIESFQLQIICKYIEDLVVASKGKSVVSKNDVPILEDIFYNFYEKAISKVPHPAWYDAQNTGLPDHTKASKIRHATQEMVEKGLIFRTSSEMGIRLNLYREQIALQYPDVDDAALWTLSQERILRETPDAAGRLRYELSHDTLIKPILHACDVRERNIREQADREEHLRLKREDAARRSREIGVSGKVNIEWNYLISCIKDHRAVLILGENALRNADGVPIFKQFVKNLDVSRRGLTYFEEEQLFWFNERLDRLKLSYELKEFYDNYREPIPLLDLLTTIPFPLVLSFDPSRLISRQLNQNSIEYQFGYYNRSKTTPDIFDFSRDRRTVFNLFGSIEDDESILITLDDVNKHLFGILGNKPLPVGIRAILNDAKVFIMYGINFSRSTNQPVLWQILYDNRSSSRLSLLDGSDLEKEEFKAKALLNIDFKPVPPELFFSELAERLSRDIKNTDKPIELIILNKLEIMNMIEKGELDIALKTLQNYLREIKVNEDREVKRMSLFNTVTNLTLKLNELNRTYLSALVTSEEAYIRRIDIINEATYILDAIYHEFEDQSLKKSND